jgi:uncharacterized membrane protein
MHTASGVAVVATFTAMIVGSDFALAGLSNVKLLDTLVFVSAYLFGFRAGASVGVLSETIWSFVSPIGMAGVITPFLVAGELLFALAGWAASRVRGRSLRLVSPYPLFIGALMAICAFFWDLETNTVTGFIGYWPTITFEKVFWTDFNPFTLAFVVAHDSSDFVFGALLAPLFILLIPRIYRSRW